MSKLLKYSPKCDATFEALGLQLAPSNPGFRTLCLARWTVHDTALRSIYQNFTVLKVLGPGPRFQCRFGMKCPSYWSASTDDPIFFFVWACGC